MGGTSEVSAEKRARQEKNLRRRVYDSLNVLYAVGVLKKDKKRVEYNHKVLENASPSRYGDDSYEKAGDSYYGVGNSHSQTFNRPPQKNKPIDVTEQCKHEVNQMVSDGERQNKEQYSRIESKFNKLTELMKQQVGLRRLIKRNRKMEEQREHAARAGGRQYTKKKREELCKIPFIVASYVPDRNRESLEYNEKSLKLTSVKPVKCYGDANILSMMQLSELKSAKDFVKHLGEDN